MREIKAEEVKEVEVTTEENTETEVAIMNADAVSSVDKANRYKRRENDSEERLNKLLAAIFAICDAADFHIEERIVVKDKRTGKVWR